LLEHQDQFLEFIAGFDFNQLDAIFKDIFDNPQLIDQYGLSSKLVVTPYLVESVKHDLENIYNSLI
jgi:hypothetical protein